MSNGQTADVVIAGAGIVGAACALEFAQAGLRVMVVEPAEIGGGATAAGMGHIVAMDDSDAQFALTRFSQLLWDELVEALPADVQFTRYPGVGHDCWGLAYGNAELYDWFLKHTRQPTPQGRGR